MNQKIVEQEKKIQIKLQRETRIENENKAKHKTHKKYAKW